MSRFVGQTAVVTGGTTGIGESIVRRLATEGATVSFCARSAQSGDALAQELHASGADVSFTPCDVGDEDQVVAWINGVAARHGRLNLVVNNAGVAASGPFAEMTTSDWERMLRTNVTGMVLVSRAAIPHLRAAGGGAILNLGSTTSYVGLTDAVGYGITKAAALGLTRGLALELAGDDIRVNALCPGATETPANVGWLNSQPNPTAVRSTLTASHPLGRLATPDEQAAVALFLLSSEASYITGAGLLVDGGYTAR
jgi:NAD(P)-dependent dehydrogenase (short-subunit alcohol dehydrogenase family)